MTKKEYIKGKENLEIFKLKQEMYDELAEHWKKTSEIFAKYHAKVTDKEATLMLIEITCRWIELCWKGEDVKEVLVMMRDAYSQVEKEDWYKRLNP